VLLAELADQGDGATHLLEVCRAALALGEVALEPDALRGREPALEIVARDVDQLLAGEIRLSWASAASVR
jgi:hypothetical protein